MKRKNILFAIGLTVVWKGNMHVFYPLLLLRPRYMATYSMFISGTEKIS